MDFRLQNSQYLQGESDFLNYSGSTASALSNLIHIFPTEKRIAGFTTTKQLCTCLFKKKNQH